MKSALAGRKQATASDNPRRPFRNHGLSSTGASLLTPTAPHYARTAVDHGKPQSGRERAPSLRRRMDRVRPGDPAAIPRRACRYRILRRVAGRAIECPGYRECCAARQAALLRRPLLDSPRHEAASLAMLPCTGIPIAVEEQPHGEGAHPRQAGVGHHEHRRVANPP